MVIFKLACTILLILSLYPETPASQWLPLQPKPKNPKPLCSSQMALVNRACVVLPPPEEEEPETRSSHRHHGQARREEHEETRAEEECCRWLKEVDDECVCDLLTHLPPFLTRPFHEYKVIVEGSCEVSFECGSRPPN